MNRVDSYKLLHHGAIALAEVEANGIAVDVPYLDKTIERTANRIKVLKERLRGCEEYKLQRRRYGQKTILTSRPQLASVLYEDMGHEVHSYTAGGRNGEHKRPQLDETALERIGTPYAKAFLQLSKLNNLHDDHLLGVRREVCNGFLHPFFGLHLVRSYRGQSDSPNFQNKPKHDPLLGKLIRRAFIPRPGHVIIEIDYSSLEVMVACALSGDPKLTYDAIEGDMHRDMAAECYILTPDRVLKPVRQSGKSNFVFAEFYGDYHKQVAPHLWDAIERYNLTTSDGLSLYDHLAYNDITELGACEHGEPTIPGTFEHHIKEVEDRFWNVRYKVYHAKRRAWVEEYKRQGYIDLVTGFRCHGPMSRNQVMNYKVQGPAFHCNLWSLITLQKDLKRYRMGAKITGQIHDSILADVPVAEVDDYLSLAHEITTQRLPAAWDWITVPFEIEAEMSDKNWYETEKVEIAA